MSLTLKNECKYGCGNVLSSDDTDGTCEECSVLLTAFDEPLDIVNEIDSIELSIVDSTHPLLHGGRNTHLSDDEDYGDGREK